jgi:hypothetical protein
LPEEANKEKVEEQELEQDLLGQKEPSAEQIEKDMNLVGDRMARSRQRLALNSDPGKVTQLIQERILIDMDKLIEQARAQQCNAVASKPGDAQKMNQVKPGEKLAQNLGNKKDVVRKKTGGSNPKPDSRVPGQVNNDIDLSQEIQETQAEWGKISPRLRDAVIEGSTEQIIEKYRRFVEDYYKGVSTRGTEQQ